MYCPKCGTPLPENALYCGGCGEAVAELPALELQSEQAASVTPSSTAHAGKKKLPIGATIPVVLLAILLVFGITHITNQTSNVSDQLQGDWRSGGTSGQLISFSPDGTCDLSALGDNFAEMESWKILPGETLKLESSSGTSMYISRSKSEAFPEQNALAPARIDTGLYCLVDDRLLIGATEFHAGKDYWNAESASPQASAADTDDENSAGLQSPQSTTPAKPIIPSTEHALTALEGKSYPPANVVDLEDDYHFVYTADGYVVGLCYKENFLLHDGHFIPIAWGAADEDYSFEDYRPYPQNLLPPERYKYLCDASKPEESRILVIDKTAGDQIATFWDTEEVHFLPYEGGTYSQSPYKTGFRSAESLVNSVFSDVEEVDGKAIGSPEEAIDILKEKGIYLSIPNRNGSKNEYDFCSDEPASFTIGKYEGTKFVKKRI